MQQRISDTFIISKVTLCQLKNTFISPSINHTASTLPPLTIFNIPKSSFDYQKTSSSLPPFQISTQMFENTLKSKKTQLQKEYLQKNKRKKQPKSLKKQNIHSYRISKNHTPSLPSILYISHTSPASTTSHKIKTNLITPHPQRDTLSSL